MRLQASIEALLVMAAFLSLLLALMPVINKAATVVSFASAAARHQQAFDELCSDAADAFVLGQGNKFVSPQRLPTDAALNFNDSTTTLYYSFNASNLSKTFSRRLGFTLALNNRTLPKGSLVFEVANDGGVAFTASGNTTTG